MTIDWFRKKCLSFPQTHENVQWGADLVFKVGEKMFAVAALEPGKVAFSFKVTPAEFASLCEQDGIIPAPYLARAQWVALEHRDALPAAELSRLLRQSYDLVVATLPKSKRPPAQ